MLGSNRSLSNLLISYILPHNWYLSRGGDEATYKTSENNIILKNLKTGAIVLQAITGLDKFSTSVGI